jgi:uncharacterized membrane protein YqaE (UPF0057 family)
MFLFSNFKVNILILFLIVLSSCSQLRYTDYGKPLDFLKSHRVGSKNIELDLNSAIKKNEKQELYPEKTIVPSLANVEKFKSIKEQEKTKVAVNNISSFQQNKSKKNYHYRISKEEIVHPLLNSFEMMEQHQGDKNDSNLDEVDDVILMILCVIIPPLAVFFAYDISNEFWIDLLLTICFFLPGIIYALYICFFK